MVTKITNIYLTGIYLKTSVKLDGSVWTYATLLSVDIQLSWLTNMAQNKNNIT